MSLADIIQWWADWHLRMGLEALFWYAVLWLPLGALIFVGQRRYRRRKTNPPA